jgi:hypothetical protein
MNEDKQIELLDDEKNRTACELCETPITEDNESDNPRRCSDCYEEWGDLWPDQI